MADYLHRAWRLQLTTAMENLMRTGVLEISQIFEDSLHDHQVELARKGEEIAHLKVKLQRAEIKLKDASVQSETTQNETLRRSEEPAHEGSAVSEIDSDVPGDWCVPLGCEIVDTQEIPCPSVRLKQFSIPLRPISLKHEAFLKIAKPRLRPRHNRDKKDLHENIKPKGLAKQDQPRIHPLKNDRIKNEVKCGVKEESSDDEVNPPIRRKGLSRKVRKTRKCRKGHRKQDNITGQMYHCKFCPKVFDTAVGLSVHDRAHKKCKVCKKFFPSPSVLKQHEVGCKHYKALLRSSPLPKKRGKTPSIKQASEEDNTSLENTSPVRRIIKKFTCKKCLKTFISRALLLKHSCNFPCPICSKRFNSPIYLKAHTTKMHKHSGNFPCPICSKSFNSPIYLKAHTTKMHKNSTDNKLEQSWTKPLDEGDIFENHIRKCSDGFKCLICKEVCVTKCKAVDHYYSHTGEKPYTCGVCLKTFSHKSGLSRHRISAHGIKKYRICACSKKFLYKFKYKEHKLNCPTAIAQKTEKF